MSCPIFISYSRKDLIKAEQIKKDVEDTTKQNCWFDIDGIESGSQFEDHIISAIDQSSVVLFLLSESSMKSEWTKKEIRYAQSVKKKIVPVSIDDSKPQGWFLLNFGLDSIIFYNNSEQRSRLMYDLSKWTNGNTTEELAVSEIHLKRHIHRKKNYKIEQNGKYGGQIPEMQQLVRENVAVQPRKVYKTKAEVLRRVQVIAHGEEIPQKEEVDYLKTAFYKLHIAERDASLKAYIDGGGDPEAYQITPDMYEEKFKAEMNIIKERLTDPSQAAAAAQDTQGHPPRTRIIKDKLPGRNDPCPCGSGKKFKNCHGRGIV